MNEQKKSPSSFVTTLDTKISGKLLQDLKNQGFEISIPQYTLFSAKKPGISCTFYQSGKLMVQGKEMGPFIEFYLEPHILKTFTFSYKDAIFDDIDTSNRIGIDESGKGDFFGPLCIAGVYGGGDDIREMKQMGVCDSKKLNDTKIITLAHQIRKKFVHHIVKINPLKYNELMKQFGNLNSLLAWGHATAIEQLVERTGCQKIIVDQFANERVVLTAVKRKKLDLDITQRHRAEEDLIVAAASILARCTFVEGIALLEKEFGMRLPKGASAATICAGRQFVRTHGRENLGKVGKLHFKTLDAIIDKTTE